MMTDTQPRSESGLTELEIASGLIVGRADAAPTIPETNLTPVAALEAALRPALEHGPCFVSFSGGRDSSLVLAAATRCARAAGLPLPIPATMRFPGVADSEENAWQEEVVRYLGLSDWIRIDATAELDLLGHRARDVLERHGLLFPWNAFALTPIFDLARGGTVVTGIDGDGLLGPGRGARAWEVLAGRVGPSPRDMVRVAYAFAPARVRSPIEFRRQLATMGLTWLRPAAERDVARGLAKETASQPPSWRSQVKWWAARRYLAMSRDSYTRIARSAGSRVVHPLMDPLVLSAIAIAGGRRGFPSRTAALKGLFADVLPGPIFERTHKAEFTSVFWGKQARDFARDWNAQRALSSLVSVDDLRNEWRKPSPHPGSFLLLHRAWLSQKPHRAGSGDQPHQIRARAD